MTRGISRDRDMQVTDLHYDEDDSGGIAPVYWSASQLLSKLDHRQPIRSEFSVTFVEEEKRQQRQHYPGQGHQHGTNRSAF